MQIPFLWNRVPSILTTNWPPGSEFVMLNYGFVIQDYGSADPDPKEIFTDAQN
jgi:hypothetical protein